MPALFARRPLLWILLCGLLLRAGLAVGLQYRLDNVLHRAFLIEGDANGYWELGQKIAAGEEYAIYDPPRRVLRMPGFPALLAATIKLSDGSLLAARLALAAVGTAACALVYWLGCELFDRRTGLFAAAIAAFSPVLAGFSVLVLSETLFAAAMLASLVAMAVLVRVARHSVSGGSAPRAAPLRGHWLALLTGLLIGAANYARPSWLLAAPLFALVYLLWSDDKKRAVLHGALILAGLAIAIAPWALRNYLVTGHAVVTTLWVGPSLYDGLNPDATGDSDMQFFENDAVMRRLGLSEYEMDRYYREHAWEFVRENPGRTLELALIKLARFWKPWPNAEQFNQPLVSAAVAVWFVPLVALAICGAWAARRQFWALALSAGPILYFTAIHLVFVSSLRYRLPAEYPLAVLAAAGFCHLLPRGSGPAA
jgi:4-amino-4-deoxy-L-arabinose transferase-like glycosyltransferase